jgi:uncharacterized protein YndB with AHSA1/START domain
VPKAVLIATSRPMKASREQLWSVLGDLDRLPEWLAFADRVSDVSGDASAEPGATYTVKPKRSYEPETRWTVSEVEPGRRQVHVSEMPMFTGVRSMVELADAAGGGVEARVRWQGDPKGVPAKLMRPWFQKRIQRNWEQSLERLDRVASS